MKKIVKYEADDGTVFDTHHECEKYEAGTKAVDLLTREFGPRSIMIAEKLVRFIGDNSKVFKKLCE